MLTNKSLQALKKELLFDKEGFPLTTNEVVVVPASLLRRLFIAAKVGEDEIDEAEVID